MAQGLPEQLIGAWKLVTYVERPVDGSAPFYPMGEEPQGLIMYTPDGHTQLMHPGRPRFASGDWFRGSSEEIKEETLGYIAYRGPFHTDEEKQTLTHSMFVSLFPNWLGRTQPRVVKIEGDMLHLSSATPIMSGGKKTMSYLSGAGPSPRFSQGVVLCGVRDCSINLRGSRARRRLSTTTRSKINRSRIRRPPPTF
jgi:hypothetical protein